MFREKNNYKFNDKILDKYQTRAVKEKTRAYLVVAGAGSGKTLTIVSKVDYLIKKENVSPKKILCISFTNETVSALKNSLEENNCSVDVKTFHKLSLDIISNRRKVSPSNLLDYITEEYFYSYLYFDKTYQLLEEYLDREKINKIQFLTYFKKVIVSFIHSFKSCNYELGYFIEIIFNCKNKDDQILLIIIFKIYTLYEEELHSNGWIDFDDMINLAIQEVDKLKYFRYKYIIIDEFQDTSHSKYALIKKLYEKYNLNLMAVGDDYQSIYSFTGCDLNIFLEFKKNFKNSKVIKLKNTYRNPKDIVDISSNFVMKNKRQLRKKLKSYKYIQKPLIIVYSTNVIENLIEIIEPLDNILIMGRTNQDVNLIIDNKNFKIEGNKITYLKDESKNMYYLTVHTSKGLEKENVVVLNMIDATVGFPSQIKEYALFKYIRKTKKETFLYAEERRLFYVALTRCKNKTYLFTNKRNPSIFIKELIKNYKWKLKIIDCE